MLTVGSLFSGIGGFDLGLERAGMRVLWQVEADARCRAVLRRHWPDVDLHEDVRDVGRANLAPVDLICGGFPCQPTSQAAARSVRGSGWLWPEYGRVVDELRPGHVVVENPESLRYAGRGLNVILRDLAALGYDAVWNVVSAADFGAPHKRARIWLVAYADGYGEPDLTVDVEAPLLSESCSSIRAWPDPPRSIPLVDGVPFGLALRMYGNAVVPQVAEWIGQRIIHRSGRT